MQQAIRFARHKDLEVVGQDALQQPENAREILSRKSAFLNDAAGTPVLLATSNHVCMMQWNSARTSGLVNRPFEVRHVIQLLDPQSSHESSAMI